jgi:hypothetical protein
LPDFGLVEPSNEALDVTPEYVDLSLSESRGSTRDWESESPVRQSR